MILGIKERAEIAALACDICGDAKIFAVAPGHEARTLFETDVPIKCWCIQHWLWGAKGNDEPHTVPSAGTTSVR